MTDPLAGLADIEVLAPPPLLDGATALLLAALLSAVLAGGVIGGLAWYRARLRRSARPAAALPPAREARRRLAGLQAEWEAGITHDRDAAYRLCTLLRNGFALRALDPAAPPAGVDTEAWREWHAAVSGARYQAGGAALTAASFASAHAWLSLHTSGDPHSDPEGAGEHA